MVSLPQWLTHQPTLIVQIVCVCIMFAQISSLHIRDFVCCITILNLVALCWTNVDCLWTVESSQKETNWHSHCRTMVFRISSVRSRDNKNKASLQTNHSKKNNWGTFRKNAMYSWFSTQSIHSSLCPATWKKVSMFLFVSGKLAEDNPSMFGSESKKFWRSTCSHLISQFHDHACDNISKELMWAKSRVRKTQNKPCLCVLNK